MKEENQFHYQAPFSITPLKLFHIRAKFSQVFYHSVQFSSVAQSCPTLCDPMNRSTPGLPVHHQLPESSQTHVDRVSDAIQPSHPLSSPSPPAPISLPQYLCDGLKTLFGKKEKEILSHLGKCINRKNPNSFHTVVSVKCKDLPKLHNYILIKN